MKGKNIQVPHLKYFSYKFLLIGIWAYLNPLFIKAQVKKDTTSEYFYDYPLKPNRFRNLMDDDSLSLFRKYHFGPKVYAFIPFQKVLIENFRDLGVNIFFGLFPEYPSSTWKPGLNLYYLSEARHRYIDSLDKRQSNRFFVLGPNFGYRYYIPTHHEVQFYFEGDVEYLAGKLRVRQSNIDTDWRTCEGIYLLGGLVIDQRIRFTITRDFLTGIDGYRFNGLTFTCSYLFHSHSHEAL